MLFISVHKSFVSCCSEISSGEKQPNVIQCLQAVSDRDDSKVPANDELVFTQEGTYEGVLHVCRKLSQMSKYSICAGDAK